MRSLVGIFLLAAPAFAQGRPIAFGVIGEARLSPELVTETSPVPADCAVVCFVDYSVPARRPVSAGGAVEARLGARLAIEIDALYGRLAYSAVHGLGSPSSGVSFAYTNTTASRWRVPVVVKYRVGRVFALAGGAADWVGGVREEGDYGGRTILGRAQLEHRVLSGTGELSGGRRGGVVAGVGAGLRAGPMRVEPQFRYTRWAGRFGEEPRSNQNDAGLFVALMF